MRSSVRPSRRSRPLHRARDPVTRASWAVKQLAVRSTRDTLSLCSRSFQEKCALFEIWLGLPELVGLFFGPPPVAGLGLLDDLVQVSITVVGELARGVAVVNPLGILIQLFRVLERNGRQQRFELPAVF